MLLDHIVHFIEKKPEDAVTFWKEQGLHAAIGGRHEKWGTYNALLYTKNSYIEWLAVENQSVAEKADHPLIDLLLHDQKGFGTICIRTENLEEVEQNLKAEGFNTSGVLPAQRTTVSGKLRKWKMLFVEELVSDSLPSPFFIEWQETDEERYESLRKDGTIIPGNEEIAIKKCVIGVTDIEASTEKWQKLLGGSLQLENSLIEFRKTTAEKERLEEVHFTGGKKKLLFENNLYFIY